MDARPLEVVGVRLFQREDGVQHHTDKFQSSENGKCFLRRGQIFHLAVSFNTTFDARFHRIQLYLYTGGEFKRLETSSDVITVLEPNNEAPWPPSSKEWGARRVHMNVSSIVIEVVSPVWLPIGQWKLEVRTKLVQYPGIQSATYFYHGTIYFLFNPWNPEDDAYFPNSELLDQFLMNDVGHIWRSSNSHTLWEYGQFESCVLPAFELALKRDGELKHHRRGSPVEVSRAIARIVNVGRNLAGIMYGRWDGKYQDGKNPIEWNGSVEILQRYLDSGGEAIKYGQCWAFAGLTVTICRALGLAARVVTNLRSAHDGDDTCTVDEYFSHELEKESDDFIWNYHCWADVWMRRRDIKNPEFDGWQAVDGTPQHLSQDHYQLGPAPIKAIKSGNTNVPYDMDFIFAEVNGDLARWIRYPSGRLRLIDVRENWIGEAQLTDDPYSPKKARVSNIIDEYKLPEGSAAERMAVWRASSSNPNAIRRRKELDSHRFLNDVEFWTVKPYSVKIGANVDLHLFMTNKSEQLRTVVYDLILDVVDHADRQLRFVKQTGKRQITLGPKEHQSQRMLIQVQEYAPKLIANGFLRFRAKCWVQETGQPWLCDKGKIDVELPKLLIHLAEEPVVNRPLLGYFSFDRPVNFPLTNIELRLGGSGIERNLNVLRLNDLPSDEKFFHRIHIKLVRAGLQKITAIFTSAEIPKVESWIEVDVRDVDILRTNKVVLNFNEHMNEILDNAFDDNTIPT